MGLQLVELLRVDGRQRVFLRIHRLVLQREVDLGEGDWRRIGAHRAREQRVERDVIFPDWITTPEIDQIGDQ